MTSISRWLVVSVMVTALGCGRQETSVPVAVRPPMEEARAILAQFVQSGETDSSIVALRELLDALAAKDPSKAGLVADCDALMTVRGKEQVKARAQELIDKLP